MFDGWLATAAGASGAGGVGAWARVENAACARRLGAMADELERMYAADGSDEREQWCLDNWDAVCAEVGAAQGVSSGVASHQLLIATALRERLPRVAAVFAEGLINYRMAAAIVARTRLITDPDIMVAVDKEIAAHVGAWGQLSVAKAEAAIDYWVVHYDPAALRRTEDRARDRHIDIHDPTDGTGLASVEGLLYAHDSDALNKRLDAMANAVCNNDPRTSDQRRADAFVAALNGSATLPCACNADDCPAAGRPAPRPVIVHVVANEESLSETAPLHLNGHHTPPGIGDDDAHLEPHGGPPAAVMGGAMLPAQLLAATLAQTARIVPITHPGDAPPERRYIPSAVLATFVRCRDMTCRFPGCDEPADTCDIDHTIAYPHGPTQASNLKCLCRKHHLLKTFGGWRDQQHADGTVVWTSPSGQTYTTYPGSRLLFPSLCRPTAPVTTVDTPRTAPNRGSKMPRRSRTRQASRRRAVESERRLNDAYVAERNRPPPF